MLLPDLRQEVAAWVNCIIYLFNFNPFRLAILLKASSFTASKNWRKNFRGICDLESRKLCHNIFKKPQNHGNRQDHLHNHLVGRVPGVPLTLFQDPLCFWSGIPTFASWASRSMGTRHTLRPRYSAWEHSYPQLNVPLVSLFGKSISSTLYLLAQPAM